MNWWPRICPVCRQELPARGNRRVYVPWCRGFRLVHTGACADSIDAQGVLDLDATPPALDPVLLVRARRFVQRLLERHQSIEHASEDVTAIAGLRVAALTQQLVGDEPAHDLRQLLQLAPQLVQRLLAQQPEACAPTRTEVAL